MKRYFGSISVLTACFFEAANEGGERAEVQVLNLSRSDF